MSKAKSTVIVVGILSVLLLGLIARSCVESATAPAPAHHVSVTTNLPASGPLYDKASMGLVLLRDAGFHERLRAVGVTKSGDICYLFESGEMGWFNGDLTAGVVLGETAKIGCGYYR